MTYRKNKNVLFITTPLLKTLNAIVYNTRLSHRVIIRNGSYLGIVHGDMYYATYYVHKYI